MLNRPFSLPVYPPGGQSPEGWLSQLDTRPLLLPTWPDSTRMALVVVEKNPTDEGLVTDAWVLLCEAQLEGAIAKGVPQLFFTIPRMHLLKSPEICPGLTPESWF